MRFDRHRRAVAAGIFCAFLWMPAGAQTPAAVIALVDGTVVNVDDGSEIPNAVVLIEGQRIKSVGRADSVVIPEGAQRVSLAGKWLAPGLMNMHVHLSLKHAGVSGALLRGETASQQVLRMAANARKSLLSGVTTLRMTGEFDGNDYALVSSINRGEMVGPRLITAGMIITTTGGHGSSSTGADGPYELARKVREQISAGAKWIKISVSGGIGDAHGDIQAAPMTDLELSTLIEVAHRNGVKVTAHNGSNVAAEQAMKFGIDCFEHGYFFNEQTLREMKKKGVWLVPTIVVSQPGIEEYRARIGSPPTQIERMKSVRDAHWKMLQTAIGLGIKIALGTDQQAYEPNSGTTATIREAEYYVKAGMTPLQAMQAATTQAAKLLEMEDQIGRIDAGKYADIIALDANPTQNIEALRTVSFVMKGGQIVRDDAEKIIKVLP